MGREALSIDAGTFQFFTRNPRGGSAKAIDPADVAAFRELARENGFAPILAHAPYTLNPSAREGRTREFAFEVMADDLRRLALTPGAMYNFHPGSHVGQGIELGIELVAELLNTILKSDQPNWVLIECMAGKGSEIGSRFEEVRAIIDRVAKDRLLGVCIDSCHLSDAGYDIVDDLDGVLAELDRAIGLDRLKAVHLNDSKNDRASRKDRHEKIGQGKLGLATIERMIKHPQLRDLPFYLETPNDVEGYAAEIKLLRSLRPD